MAGQVLIERVLLVKAKDPPADERIMFLSSVDQRFGAYQRNLLIFDCDEDPEAVVGRLREAMEELLVPYDFFAGRLQRNERSNKFEISCNNAGALLAVAAAQELSVDEVKTGPIETQQFLYFPVDAKSVEELPMLTVQVTSFSCSRGFAIGVLCHHSITDATSGVNFLHNFSSVTRKNGLLIVPNSDRTVLKARNPPRPQFPHEEFIPHADLNNSRYSISLDTAINFPQPKPKTTAAKKRKAFHFSFQKLTTLKTRALQDESLRECTSFEALAAFVWRAQSLVLCQKQPEETLRLRFVLDVRNKVVPPLGSSFCGNAIYWAHAEVKFQDMLDRPLSHIILQIQKARKQITNEYLRSGWDFLELNPDHWYGKNCDMGINAWPRAMLSAKELDFGWGKPARVEFPLDPETSTVMFLPVEDGVEVSMLLEPHQSALFSNLMLL